MVSGSSIVAGTGIICVAVLVLTLGITTTVIAFQNEDDNCQHDKRASMYLSDWLKISGLEPVCLVGFFAIMIPVTMATDSAIFVVFLSVIAVLHVLFTFAWWVIGIVMVATNGNNECVAEGTALGVMAIISLVLVEVNMVFAGVAKLRD